MPTSSPRVMPQQSRFPAKTLIRLRDVKIMTATFTDAKRTEDTRLVLVDEEGRVFFLHPEGMDAKLKQPADWLKEAILDHIAPKDEAAAPEISASEGMEMMHAAQS